MSIVITGTGAVTPAGDGVEPLWNSARAGTSHLATIDRFDAGDYACPVAYQADFDADAELPSRFVKRTDRFTHLAVHTVRRALADAGVAVGTDVSPERTGVMVGNILGGWEFAERELRKLWIDGPRAVSPYQATAWFPAAPQGNICIDQGIKGPARTFVADRASGAYALIGAAETLLRGRADVVLAGGVEAPLSPYGWLCLETSGLVAKARGSLAPHELYRPFDAGHGGSVFAEGSVFLVMERREHAERRGARILGELAGFGASAPTATCRTTRSNRPARCWAGPCAPPPSAPGSPVVTWAPSSHTAPASPSRTSPRATACRRRSGRAPHTCPSPRPSRASGICSARPPPPTWRSPCGPWRRARCRPQ